MLAKAVANQTSATFLRVTGSELIQKYLGDGPKLVRELFRVAEEQVPCDDPVTRRARGLDLVPRFLIWSIPLTRASARAPEGAYDCFHR